MKLPKKPKGSEAKEEYEREVARIKKQNEKDEMNWKRNEATVKKYLIYTVCDEIKDGINHEKSCYDILEEI